MATTIRGDDNFDTADNATQTELDNKVVGKVLQVVTHQIVNMSTTSEATFASVSIFKTSGTNKVVIDISALLKIDTATSGWSGAYTKVYDGATELFSSDFIGAESGSNWTSSRLACNFVDSRNLSSVTYTFKLGVNNSSLAGLGGFHNDTSPSGFITLTEIGV